MEIRCKLHVVDDKLYDIIESIKVPIRSYEVEPTEESLGLGRSMVCEFDYTIYVPSLELFFRFAAEFEYDYETKEDEYIEEILHFYRYGDTKPLGGDYTNIRSLALWYIKENHLDIENGDDLDCIIDMPYDIEMKEQ